MKQELAIIKNLSLLDRYCFIAYDIKTSFIKNSENVESRTMTTQQKTFSCEFIFISNWELRVTNNE